MDDLQASGANASQNLLPTLKRRNSGKRNLHKPWTAVEEDQLVRLVEQAEYRKQVSRGAAVLWDVPPGCCVNHIV